MLSPKMQRTCRVNEAQILTLSERAQCDTGHQEGYLYKRTSDSNKWQLRFFVLCQNLLFYYDSNTSTRPLGLIFLEGCYCDRIVTTPACLGAPPSSHGTPGKTNREEKSQYCFQIIYRKETQRRYELRAASESELNTWIMAIRDASFGKIAAQKEALEAKHVHLLQVVESEKTAKWQYTQQCEEFASEIRKLRLEICQLRKEQRGSRNSTPVGRGSFSAGCEISEDPILSNLCQSVKDTDELNKIKKVQSFFRGWLCRRRWKQIVDEYIKSPHAESMRKRNSLVFSMVEAEEEYLEQLEVLVACFQRPFKMAASSKKPPCSHEDVNSIFLNSETVLFLHQIFYKGLTSRLESWPTLVLGDLFDMLLPMLSIYQEYVRNHHFSLQVLTECKNNQAFSPVLKRLEAKPVCQGRSLETFLTYPMHQIPRYIITLHELLAHTPHDHVERKSLQNARQQLEDLSRLMHDEVSETENLRKNLAVERMILEGCDILLDVNQVFVRQGSLVQAPPGRWRLRSRLASFKSERESVRQCFLFSNHMIIATRASNGRLHLLPDVGKITLADATLIEDPSDSSNEEDEQSVCSASTRGSTTSVNDPINAGNRDFKIIIEAKVPGGARQTHSIHLVAPTVQDKEAWISDITQCLDNIHMHSLLSPGISGSSGGSIFAAHHAVKADPRLFKDDVDIRFSRTLNSCKLPQVRYATPERLLQRLTDLRFLSIDFLNTFLLTYRVFTDGETVLNALKNVFYNPPQDEWEQTQDFLDVTYQDGRATPRRTSGASSVSGYCSEGADRDRSLSGDSSQLRYRMPPRRMPYHYGNPTGKLLSGVKEHFEQRYGYPEQESLAHIPEGTQGSVVVQETQETTVEVSIETPGESYLAIPNTIAASSSTETIMGASAGPSSPSNLSSVTLIGSTGSGNVDRTDETPTEEKPIPFCGKAPKSPLPERKRPQQLVTPIEMKTNILPPTPTSSEECVAIYSSKTSVTSTAIHSAIVSTAMTATAIVPQSAAAAPATTIIVSPSKTTVSRHGSQPVIITTASSMSVLPIGGTSAISPPHLSTDRRASAGFNIIPQAALSQHRHSIQLNGDGGVKTNDKSSPRLPYRKFSAPKTPERQRKSLTTPQKESIRRFSESDDENMSTSLYTPRGSVGGVSLSTISSSHRPSMQNDHHAILHSSKAGVVITSFRQAQRRSSTSTAATAFAIATSAASNPRDEPPEDARKGEEQNVGSPATMRVLNVLRHWVSKHFQDFEQDATLRAQTIGFLDEITMLPHLLPTEHRAASQLLRLLTRDDLDSNKRHLEILLAPPAFPSKESLETLSALEIAEQMTYLDHQIFLAIRSEEFLGQSWMKADKKSRADHIIQMTKRFNDGARLVSSEIVSRTQMSARVAAIEKWTAVADICRCLHNFNGVLQITAAFTSAAVYRMKKTWDKVPKNIKQTISKLQAVVCSEGRFRVMRDQLHRCDPPCIPYLGMYLTDLSFIEEGTSDFTPEGLLNFSKMRMIAHVIREIRHFQQTPYKIDHITKVSAYLLDTSLLLDDDEMYARSLQIEPRSSRLSAPSIHNISKQERKTLGSGGTE